VGNRRSAVKARVGDWLSPQLEPADLILAGTSCRTGPSPWWESPLVACTAIVAVMNFIPGLDGLRFLANTQSSAIAVIAGLMSVTLQLRRRPAFVALTSREIIVVRTTGSGWPVRVLSRAPVTSVQLAAGKAGRLERVLLLSEAGIPGKERQLRVDRRSFQDLNDLLATLVSAGALVQGLLGEHHRSQH
jgi:hypothetical protein